HTFRAGEACAVVFGEKERVLALAGSYLDALPEEVPVFYEHEGLTYAEKLSKAAELASGHPHVLVLDPLGIPSFGDPKSSRASVLYGELESLIASRPFVGNVLDIFENENRIGLMVPPLPVYGNYFENLGDGYAGRFDEAVKLARELGVSFPISDKNPPAYSLGGGFWAKSEVLKAAAEKLSGHGEADELLMKIVLPYLFQAEGCLTATLTGSRYAGTYATNLDYAMRENNKVVFERFGPDYFWSEIDKINKRD
ncbi:MAG: rhamnan synthesis F family protein, partial [Lachnospiraceae bacterium]|nr:rhamnan synthesis F family protein [Lachnospiraceae bacterium]